MLDTTLHRIIETWAARLALAKRVVVLTGAGASAESGLRTFRDPDGLWASFKPEELATPQAFRANPLRVQQWYAVRREALQQVTPNPGHLALTELEKRVPDFTLVTQNIDGLHQKAGSQNVLELHGNLARLYCDTCGAEAASPTPPDDLHRCTSCTGLIRPDVVWFGEMLPMEVLEKATHASSKADVFLSIGTRAEVYPAAGLPLLAREQGAGVAEINIAPSAIASRIDATLLGPAGEILPQLLQAIDAFHQANRP